MADEEEFDNQCNICLEKPVTYGLLGTDIHMYILINVDLCLQADAVTSFVFKYGSFLRYP